MYPYRCNTGLYQKNTAINSRENTNTSVTKQDLSQDKRLLELLNIAQQEIQQSMQSYSNLMQNNAIKSPIKC